MTISCGAHPVFAKCAGLALNLPSGSPPQGDERRLEFSRWRAMSDRPGGGMAL